MSKELQNRLKRLERSVRPAVDDRNVALVFALECESDQEAIDAYLQKNPDTASSFDVFIVTRRSGDDFPAKTYDNELCLIPEDDTDADSQLSISDADYAILKRCCEKELQRRRTHVGWLKKVIIPHNHKQRF